MFSAFFRGRALAARPRFTPALVFVLAASLTTPCTVPLPAYAGSLSLVSGRVIDASGHPVAGASVALDGQNIRLHTTSGAGGAFAFTTAAIGEYHVSAAKAQLSSSVEIFLAGDTTSVTVILGALHEIGQARVTGNPPALHSGTDVVISGAQLAHSPSGGGLPDILAQLPSAARGSNGQIHINGDHDGLNYVIDGVQLPSSLNRVLGNEVDPSDIGSVNVLQGAYPAQYGDRFASVIEIGTKTPNGPAGADGSIEAGSYGTLDTTLGYHTPLAGGAGITVGVRNATTNRGIDPPVANFVHNRSSDGSQFLRYSKPVHGSDTLNVDILHSNQTFQIPPDTGNGISATSDDAEYQEDTFASMMYRHDINGHGSLSFGPSLKISRILDTNDLAGDLGPGSAPPPAGTATNCTDFSDCPYFSVFADRSSHDYRFNTDYVLRSPHHEIRAGGVYDATVVDKNYVITLQPFTALNPTGTFTAVDAAPNVAHQQEVYLQDSWKMGRTYQLDYGARADAFQVFSTQFDRGFSQVSPRVKLTRIFTPRASMYAYYGRLFVPFSFENVSPQTAASLYAPANAPGGGFDLKPQRDSLYETGGHLPLGSGELGIRISHKVSTDWLDDTQVGATNLHQDINFPQGRVDIQTAYYQQPLPRNGKAYISLTHSIAVNSANCETQLLQNCAIGGLPGGDFVQADHDQHYDVAGGFQLNDARHGWFSMDTEYGSGLSLGDPALCPSNDAVNCKVPPHWIFGAEKGIALGPDTSLALIMHNILNDHYALTLDSTLQGTHYADPRTVFLQLKYRQ